MLPLTLALSPSGGEGIGMAPAPSVRGIGSLTRPRAAGQYRAVLSPGGGVWDNFETAARTQARLQGLPDLALVVVPHRKGGETADDQRAKAAAALPAIVASLVEPI